MPRRGFHKNGFCVADVIGDEVEILVGHNHCIRKSARRAHDADDCAIRAVVGKLPSAHLACMTRTIDLAHHALTGETA